MPIEDFKTIIKDVPLKATINELTTKYSSIRPVIYKNDSVTYFEIRYKDRIEKFTITNGEYNVSVNAYGKNSNYILEIITNTNNLNRN